MARKTLLLADLVNMDAPGSVMAEVKNIVLLMSRDFDLSCLDTIVRDVIDLYHGAFPGYRHCTTQYHDLRHTTDIMLALARLMHGAHITGVRFADSEIKIALYSALLHDCGYIQAVNDTTGTGGKYTLSHVQRGITFMTRYLGTMACPREEIDLCRDFITCTNHAAGTGNITFSSPHREMLGKMVASADLVGQFADRLYVEKLLFLYREFREAQLDYESELDLLRRTVDFYERTKRRLGSELGNVTRFMKHHFRMRWNQNADLYMESIDSNLGYLAFLIRDHENDYRQKLKRGGVLQKLLDEEAKESDGAVPSYLYQQHQP